MAEEGGSVQLARSVESLDRARAFFRDALGLTELLVAPGLAVFDLAGTRLVLRETGQREAADLLYLGVLDIAAVQEQLAGQGVVFQGPPQRRHRHPDGSEEWMALFADDEGRPLALHSVVPAAMARESRNAH